jgi:hypothetical protein
MFLGKEGRNDGKGQQKTCHYSYKTCFEERAEPD